MTKTLYQIRCADTGKLLVNESSKARAITKFFNIKKCGVITDKFGKKIKVNLIKNF